MSTGVSYASIGKFDSCPRHGMDLVTIFTIGWLGWLAIFLAIEIPGLIRKGRGDTLTDHVMWLKRFKVFNRPVGFVMFAVFWIWLTLHFWLEKF